MGGAQLRAGARHTCDARLTGHSQQAMGDQSSAHIQQTMGDQQECGVQQECGQQECGVQPIGCCQEAVSSRCRDRQRHGKGSYQVGLVTRGGYTWETVMRLDMGLPQRFLLYGLAVMFAPVCVMLEVPPLAAPLGTKNGGGV